jgi:hypothetical protein
MLHRKLKKNSALEVYVKLNFVDGGGFGINKNILLKRHSMGHPEVADEEDGPAGGGVDLC